MVCCQICGIEVNRCCEYDNVGFNSPGRQLIKLHPHSERIRDHGFLSIHILDEPISLLTSKIYITLSQWYLFFEGISNIVFNHKLHSWNHQYTTFSFTQETQYYNNIFHQNILCQRLWWNILLREKLYIVITKVCKGRKDNIFYGVENL